MSAEGLIREFEGRKLTAYADLRGIPTVGWGHTGRDVYIGLVITPELAEQHLRDDLAEADAMLKLYSPGPMAPGAEDALTDFIFNIGTGHYRTSNLRRLVNAREWSQVKTELLLWDHSNGHVVAGLLRRRQAEADLIVTG